MKYCSACGAQVPDNAAFCPHCGARLGAPQYQQPEPRKKTYMDRVDEAREARKHKNGKIKWWMWVLIGIGTYLLITLDPLGLY